METKNKIALVTGGSRGLGKDMALRIAEKGLDVIITYNSKAEDAEAVVGQIKQKGQKAAALQLNVGDTASFNSFIDNVRKLLSTAFGADKIDYLVNNAGVGAYVPFEQMTEDTFDDLLNIHFKGVYFLTQKLLPVFNNGGGIINISSGLTRVSMPGSSAYAAMKGSIEVFTRYLAKELGERGIKANVVAPGAIMTDFGGGRLRSDPERQKMISSVTALGRPGVAEDIGGVVAFLCTEDARWVNGQRIEASGGMMI
ncbi:SDR family NAD(P)-dependent oxidoreductase [Mucilaginibacter aquatilis]|uniref:SDR family oxidoreductase n=1 Tax=Mucilaginibacter aquatilis TaxID=1517760 RepID=A0A6I4I8P3_9SPHI|nr:SDR family oxidoreductase [Mucilaginibacter aquatilis]MVN89839.1 SDR family oxidoreductase [Mucilaginibacter aquatilis]